MAVLKTRQKRKKDILNAVVLAELFLMFPGTHSLAEKVNHAKNVGMQDRRLLNKKQTLKIQKKNMRGKQSTVFL